MPHSSNSLMQADKPAVDSRYVVLFDLDETLVYVLSIADEQWTQHAIAAVEGMCIETQSENETFRVVVRPYARELLRECEAMCEVGFFTAAERSYAEPIIRNLLPSVRPDRCFFRDSCQTTKGSSGESLCFKDLPQLGFTDLSRVVLVDNLAPSNVFPPQNGMYCFPFEVTPSICWTDLKKDTILTAFKRIIAQVISSDDVRPMIQQVNKLLGVRLEKQ